MNPTRPSAPDRLTDADRPRYSRRHVLALGAGAGVALLAGCAADTTLSDPDGSSSSDGTAGGDSAAGTFRLLISDQPVAIDDFDELNVSFDRARLFRGEGVDEPEAEVTETPLATTADPEVAEPANTTETSTATETDPANATSSPTSTPPAESEPEGADGDPDDGDRRGFTVIDLGGATVDLTQVVGEKAIGVFEGELEAGRYTKIELSAADVEGIVEGELVEVTIPSGKLQIVKPFEVVAGEALSFVFDINVVKKGPDGEYNLLPVISESGVAGQEVEVNEVANRHEESGGMDDGEPDDDGEKTEDEDEDPGAAGGDDGRGNGDGGGPPDDDEEDS